MHLGLRPRKCDMQTDLLISNLTNPAFLFFVLGILAVLIKSDLEIPSTSSKFISMYLLFAIGFKGGQELSHEEFSGEIVNSIVLALILSLAIPVYTFFILRRKLNVYDAGAIAAAYGSVSAVTFVTSVSYLELLGKSFHGHMVAIMALMEAPAIIAGLFLLSRFSEEKNTAVSKREVIRHSLTNGSVVLILGSLLIGYFSDAGQAEGIKPFTNDIFKGFLAIFLLDMGITSGKNLSSLKNYGWFPYAFAILIPLVNGVAVAWLSALVSPVPENRFMFGILAASASYIAVPAAMRIANPKANPGIYLPMSLAITFPVNITIGMPLYWAVANW